MFNNSCKNNYIYYTYMFNNSCIYNSFINNSCPL